MAQEESVYNIIKQPALPPVKGPLYHSVRSKLDIPPSYSTFNTHGTSQLVGNPGGYADSDVACVHPSKRAYGAIGKELGHTVNQGDFLRMSGKRGVVPPSSPSSPPRAASAGVGAVGGGGGGRSSPTSRGVNGGDGGGDANGEGADRALFGDGAEAGVGMGTLSPSQAQRKKKPWSAPVGSVKPFQRPLVTEPRPPVPKHNDTPPPTGVTSNKNFVLSNAVEAIATLPRLPKRQPLLGGADTTTTEAAPSGASATRSGSSGNGRSASANNNRNISSNNRSSSSSSSSGGNMTKHGAFGQVPSYITRRRGVLNSDKQSLLQTRGHIQRHMDPFTRLPSSELDSLRAALKSRWEALNKEFLTRRFSAQDTGSRKQQHEALENELKTVEAALSKLSRNIIYVYDEDKAAAAMGPSRGLPY